MKTVVVDDEIHRQLKVMAATRGAPLQDLVEMYLKQGLRKDGIRVDGQA